MSTDVSGLPLVGGHAALDLVNTVAPRVPVGSDEPHDHLTDPSALLLWGQRVGLLDDLEAIAVAQAWERDPGSGPAALAATREVREALHPTLLKVAGLDVGDPPRTRSALDQLHIRWAAAVGRSRLEFGPGSAATVRLVVGMSPALLLADRAVQSAIELLLNTDLARLRRCPTESGGCGWLFLDHSRNGSRRWCRMADCGTEVKARRLTQRRREARSGVQSLPETDVLEEA